MTSKTETQIAKENIKRIEDEMKFGGKHENWEYGTNPTLYGYEARAEEHKTSCQRFLEFLEDYEKDTGDFYVGDMVFRKITDLKQAIKLYNGAGI